MTQAVISAADVRRLLTALADDSLEGRGTGTAGSAKAARIIADAMQRVEELTDALADNTRSAVPEQAAFRLDFPRWRASLRERDRAVLDALAGGEGTEEAARRFGISPGRVSQLRRDFEQGWAAFEVG